MRTRSSTKKKNIRPALNAAAAALFCLFASTTASFADIGSERQKELLYLLEQDCGSCHGMTRKGGLGSPLLPSVLAEKSDETLAGVILDGIPGVPMPPWRPFINPEEAKWLVQVLRNKKDDR